MKLIHADSAGPNVRPADRAEAKPASKTGAASRFWLARFFWLARHAPRVVRLIKRPVVWLAVGCSPKIRRCTTANAERIFHGDHSRVAGDGFAKRVVGQFYDFVVDVGRSSSMTAAQLRDRIEFIEGRDAYVARRRATGGGAIIVTAHMGPFEIGLAALTEVEEHIHVVFKRDAMDGFESPRRALRRTLGVHEAPIDDGWETWMRLRDALEQNHVVVMQGDRAMPGQKAQAVLILGGHLLLPLGPVKLAQLSGSPIIPVFTVRSPGGRCRVFAEPAICVDSEAALIDGVHPALVALGKVFEKYIAAYPDQWLVLDAAFVEDTANAAAKA